MAYEILFMGTPEFSVPILKCLNSKHKILSVYTQPPKKNLEVKNSKIPNSSRVRKIKTSYKIPRKFK